MQECKDYDYKCLKSSKMQKQMFRSEVVHFCGSSRFGQISSFYCTTMFTKVTLVCLAARKSLTKVFLANLTLPNIWFGLVLLNYHCT